MSLNESRANALIPSRNSVALKFAEDREKHLALSTSALNFLAVEHRCQSLKQFPELGLSACHTCH